MNCLHPVRMFDTGYKTAKGKPAYIMDRIGSPSIPVNECLNRGYVVSRPLTKYIEIPCGTCVACRGNKSRQWAFRCQAEMAVTNGPSYFITITYDDEHCPHDLVKSDLQALHKRMRRAFGSFRFYACGEYGDRTHRPHYHGLYFGLVLNDLQLYKKTGQFTLYNSPMLDSLWGKGFVVVAEATFETAAYTAGYVDKKVGFRDVFQVMSRKPGLGMAYFRSKTRLGERLVLPTGKGGFVVGSCPRSAFPDQSLPDHDFADDTMAASLEGYEKSHLELWRWLHDDLLNHPKRR